MRSPKRVGSEIGLWAKLEAPLLLGRPHLDLGTICLPLYSRSQAQSAS